MVIAAGMLAMIYLLISGNSPRKDTDMDLVPKQDTVAETTNDKEQKSISPEELRKHNTSKDCWLAVEGKVYDASQYIASQKHPGGEMILQGCGKDATELFNNRPNGSGSHSQRAKDLLQTFYIGELAQ